MVDAECDLVMVVQHNECDVAYHADFVVLHVVYFMHHHLHILL